MTTIPFKELFRFCVTGLWGYSIDIYKRFCRQYIQTILTGACLNQLTAWLHCVFMNGFEQSFKTATIYICSASVVFLKYFDKPISQKLNSLRLSNCFQTL